MKTKNMFSYLFIVGAMFGGVLGLGSEQVEARTFIEGNEQTVLQFIPKVGTDGTLQIKRSVEGDYWENWFSGKKTPQTPLLNGEPIWNEMAYITSSTQNFDHFNEFNGLFTIGSDEVGDNTGVDDTGYFIFDSHLPTQVNIGYTRTEKRAYTLEESEYTYENAKTGVLYSEAHSLASAVDMLQSESRLNQIFAHPVLRFEAALVQGDSTAQFALGSNVNYNYYNWGEIPNYGGSEGSQIYHYQGMEYKEFYMPLPATFSGPSKMFIDVDAKTLGQQTEYSFRNFQVVLERYVPILMASYEELLLLDGIGTTLAQRIIDYRETTGFSSLDDLQNVKGIGPATVAKIKAQGLARVHSYFD